MCILLQKTQGGSSSQNRLIKMHHLYTALVAIALMVVMVGCDSSPIDSSPDGVQGVSPNASLSPTQGLCEPGTSDSFGECGDTGGGLGGGSGGGGTSTYYQVTGRVSSSYHSQQGSVFIYEYVASTRHEKVENGSITKVDGVNNRVSCKYMDGSVIHEETEDVAGYTNITFRLPQGLPAYCEHSATSPDGTEQFDRTDIF